MHDEDDAPEATEDFAAMLAEQGAVESLRLQVGDKVTGRIAATGEDEVELATAEGNRSLAITDVAQARVQVEFNRKES